MVFVITGGVGAGKTSLLREVVARLRRRGFPLAGFLSKRVFRGDELRGYDLVDLATGKRTPWLRRGAEGNLVGPWAVVPEGLHAGKAIIIESPPSVLLVVDEFGPAELGGRGFWPFLSPLLADKGRTFLFVVRTACLPAFRKNFSSEDLDVFRVAASIGPDDVVRKILTHGR